MNKSLLIKLLKYPLIFLTLFYIYYGWITYDVNSFYYIGTGSLLLLPKIYFNAFIWLLFITIAFIILQKWQSIYKIALLSIIPITFIYVFQYFSVYYTGNYLIKEALGEMRAITIYLNLRNIITSTIFILIGLVFIFALKKNKQERKVSWLMILIQTIITLICFAGAFTTYYTYQKISTNYASAFPSPKSTPEVALIKILLPNEKSQLPQITKDEYDILNSEYGMHITQSDYPYYKNYIYNKQEDTIQFNSKEKPNIIIFFAESLSARFLTPYQSTFDSITPNIDIFAQESLIVDNYFNHTIPTLNGLVGQLCSVYPYFTNKDFEDQNLHFKIKSMIDILNDNDYHSSCFCYENKGFTLYNTMKLLGFKERYFKQDIEYEMQFKSSRNDYLSDNDLFHYYIRHLKQQKTDKPFVHLFSSIDTHLGYELAPNTHKYPKHSNTYLTAVHNFDQLWGQFWTWFKTSPLKENTIVILTADHCLPIGADNKELYHDSRIYHSMFDIIPLIIYSPFHQLPPRIDTQASSISFAPTVMQLLGINDTTNNFAGKSIFEKNSVPYILGVYSDMIFRKDKNSNFIDIQNDTTMHKWYLLNKYTFDTNKLYK